MGELQTQAMGIIDKLVEKNPTLASLQAIIAPAAQTVSNLSNVPTLVSGACGNPPQTIDLNPKIKPKYMKCRRHLSLHHLCLLFQALE